MVSAYRPSVGRNITAKSVVCGGTMYLSPIDLAWIRIARSNCARGGQHQLGIALFVGVEQALVVFARELAVDRQPYRGVGILAAAGQAHGEIDHLATIRAHADTAAVLVLGEGLFEDSCPAALHPSRRAS